MSRVLVLISHSTEDPNRAVGALHAAHALAQAGASVDLWLHGEGVRLGVLHVAEALQEPFPVPAAELLAGVTARGGVLWCSAPCFAQRGFEPDALRPGARLAEPGDLARLLAAGVVPLSL
jgi:predicted peroxiredoxin